MMLGGEPYAFTVLPSKFALLDAQIRATREQEFQRGDKNDRLRLLFKYPTVIRTGALFTDTAYHLLPSLSPSSTFELKFAR